MNLRRIATLAATAGIIAAGIGIAAPVQAAQPTATKCFYMTASMNTWADPTNATTMVNYGQSNCTANVKKIRITTETVAPNGTVIATKKQTLPANPNVRRGIVQTGNIAIACADGVTVRASGVTLDKKGKTLAKFTAEPIACGA